MTLQKRRYNQACHVARALDLVGDRWTLLLVRELLIGPRRFRDLLSGLPGIGPNLLSSRLKGLEAEGVVERFELPAPAGVTAYRLTPLGADLEPVVLALFQWGWKHAPVDGSDTHYHPAWTAFALRGLFNSDEARGLDESYEFEIDGVEFQATIQDGELNTGLGPALRKPAFRLSADEATFQAMASGKISLDEFLERGGRIEGDRAAFARSARVFSGTPEA